MDRHNPDQAIHPDGSPSGKIHLPKLPSKVYLYFYAFSIPFAGRSLAVWETRIENES